MKFRWLGFRMGSRRINILSACLVGGFAIGVGWQAYLGFKQNAGNDLTSSTIPLISQERECGVTPKTKDGEAEWAKEWLVEERNYSSSVIYALNRSLGGLPVPVLTEMKRRNIRFAIDERSGELSCSTHEGDMRGRDDGGSGMCIKNFKGKGPVIIIQNMKDFKPSGDSDTVGSDVAISRSILPSVFWWLFNQAWDPGDERKIFRDAQEVSWGNRYDQIKKHVVEAIPFGPNEKSFYTTEFDAAGTSSPQFVNRSIVLMASNLYCKSDSFERLDRLAHEATLRFMKTFGCVVGRPWHMAEDRYQSYCPAG